MKSLLWKEFRENAKWAAFPLLLFGGILAVYGPRPCMNGEFLVLVSAVAAVFGGVLGFLQVASESQGDRRALLLHRPMSASRIFMAKAIVGAGICLVALGVPFAVNAVWTALPGHVAEPFRWPVVLPWLADILTGLVYYFAGMLMAERQGRWYGSRCLGFPAALLSSLLVWNVSEFWQAIAAILVCGGLAAVAAWGSFIAGGAYKPQPLIAKGALAITFLAGLTVLSVEGKFMLGMMLVDGNVRYYHMDRGGRLLVVHQLPNRDLRVTDLEDRDLPDFQPKHLASNEAMSAKMAPLTTGATFGYRSYRTLGAACVPCGNETTPRGEKWFFVAEQGRLMGYDSRKRLIGSVGPDGFALAGEQTTERFQGKLFSPSTMPRSGGWPDYLAFPNRVYVVDFRRRAVKTLFTPADGETVLWAEILRDGRSDPTLAFICTDRSVHAVDEEGHTVFSAPLEYDPTTYGSVRFRRLVNPQRYSVWYAPSIQLGMVPRQTLPQHFLEYDAAGKKIAHQTVPALPYGKVSRAQAGFGLVTSPAELAILLTATRKELFGTAISPGTEFGPYSLFLVLNVIPFLPDTVELDGGRKSSQVLAFGAIMLLSAAGSAAACFFLARRYAFSFARCVGWALGGLLFGPTGLLLMLAIQQWPARIACNNCRKQRVVDRECCEHCGVRHAQPESDGTEIFEQSADRLSVSAPC